MLNLLKNRQTCPSYQTVDWSSQNIKQNKCCDMCKYCCCLGGQCISKRSPAKKSCCDLTLVHLNTSMHISVAHTGWEVLAKGQSLHAFDCFLIICARPNWPLPTVEVCFAAVLHNTTNFRKSDYFFKDFSFHCLYLIFFCSSWVYGRFSCRRLGTIFKIVTTNGRDGELSWWEKIYNNSLCVGGKCVQHKAQSAGQLKQASFLHKKGPTLFKRRKWNIFWQFRVL